MTQMQVNVPYMEHIKSPEGKSCQETQILEIGKVLAGGPMHRPGLGVKPMELITDQWIDVVKENLLETMFCP